MRLIVIAFLFISVVSCYDIQTPEKLKNTIDTLNIQGSAKLPKVDVFISLKDSVISNKNKISMNIRLTNNYITIQKLLFDQPRVSTGGPWHTSASVRNIKTNESVVEFENKAMLSSQIYFEKQLMDYYYVLKPGQSISRDYLLTNLVVYKGYKDYLPDGVYEIQVFYLANSSNKVTLFVK